MKGDHIKIYYWLLPLTWLYYIGVWVRNAFFNMGLLKSKRYDIPIIDVGNITVGGTGKTPHVEYLIRLLTPKYKVAVLSRGYKRKSKGYLLATPDMPMTQTGDEPWQMKQKFPQVYVAVDANRRRGIERLMNDPETRDVQVILLDDAFQHRYVKPGLNILLVDYNRIITDDTLLPAGRLREPASARSRAQMVIVTKCPHDTHPISFRVAGQKLGLKPFQKLYFSTLRYSNLKQLFGEKTIPLTELRNENYHILLLSGIGSPLQMEQDLRHYAQHITPLSYPDHHYYSAQDAERICQELKTLSSPNIIITTEKDATRLRDLTGLDEKTRNSIYVLPIEVDIMKEEKDNFNFNIQKYVQSNTRNSSLDKGKNA